MFINVSIFYKFVDDKSVAIFPETRVNFRQRRSRSASNFPVNDLSVGRSVGLSSALWKNDGSDPDAV